MWSIGFWTVSPYLDLPPRLETEAQQQVETAQMETDIQRRRAADLKEPKAVHVASSRLWATSGSSSYRWPDVLLAGDAGANGAGAQPRARLSCVDRSSCGGGID